MKKYLVSAVPFDGFETFRRAGMAFGATPTEVVVVPDGQEPTAGSNEITAAQLAAIEAEPRLKVTTPAGKVVAEGGEVAGAAAADKPAKK